jgi:hypothetical protein
MSQDGDVGHSEMTSVLRACEGVPHTLHIVELEAMAVDSYDISRRLDG